MGSVIATWKGCCTDESIRQELFSYLYEIATVIESRRMGQQVPRPAFLEALEDSRRLPESLRSQDVMVYDQTVTGKIGIEAGLLTFEELDESLRAGAKLVPEDDELPLAQEASRYALHSLNSQKHYTLDGPNVSLKGLAFRLYDPRGLYPGEDVMGFVFIDAPNFPQLHGKMVQPLNHEECIAYIDSKVTGNFDWFMCVPSVHLRYLLEGWFDALMAWVKFFFLPELYFWRYEEFSGFAKWKEIFERSIGSHGHDFTQTTIYEYLVDSFEREASDWEARVADMALECGIHVDSLAKRMGSRNASMGEDKQDRASSSLVRLYAMLFSRYHNRKSQAARQLVRLLPNSAQRIEMALKSSLSSETKMLLLDEIMQHTQNSESIAEGVLYCLLDDRSSIGMRNLSAYALARMSPVIDARLLEVLCSTVADHWQRVKDHLLPLFPGDRIQLLLENALNHDSGEVRLRACEYLAERKHPETESQFNLNCQSFFEPLLLQIQTAPEDLRNAIVQAIVGMNDQAFINLQSMISAPSELIQVSGIDGWSILVADTPRCNVIDTELLKAMLAEMVARLDHESPKVRIAAAIAVQRTATAIACRRLSLDSQSESSDVVLKVAHGYRSIADTTLLKDFGEQLRTTLRDRKVETIAARRAAAAQLTGSKKLSPTTFLLLRKGIQDNEDPWRHEYLAALRPFGSSKVVRGVSDLIADAIRCDSRLQRAGLELLIDWEADLNEVSEGILSCLNSPSATIRKLVANALGTLRPPHPDGLYHLSRMLLDPSDEVVEQACRALGKCGQAADVFVPNILELDDRFPLTVIQALEGIQTMQAKNAVANFYRASQDDEALRMAYRILDDWGMTPDVPPPADEAAEDLLNCLFRSTDSESADETEQTDRNDQT